MSSNSDRRSAVDYATQDQSRQDGWDREEEIETLIERCSRAKSRGEPQHYRYVATTLSDTIIPLLEEHTGQSVLEFDEELGAFDDWNYIALSEFMDSSTQFAHTFNGQYKHTALPERDHACDVIEKALRSVTTIASAEGILLEEYTSKTTVEGFCGKIGQWLQDEKMDVGDPVSAFAEEETGYKSLHSGRTNAGKSTGLETEVWEYYQRNHREGQDDCKVIDLVGFRQGENWLYDVPQQQPELRQVREDMDLPPDFTESDADERPTVEILVPLVDGIADQKLPFDTEADDDGDFVVRPYTVPACEIRKPILVSLIDALLTQTQENTFRNIYDEVDRSINDWTLNDIANEVRSRETLSDKDKDTAIGALRSLQDEGFIRTKSSEYTIDWEEVYYDTETITIFSQARKLLPSELAQVINVAYLADAIFETRNRMNLPPELVVVMRELWEVAPHRGRSKDDRRAEGVQEAMGSVFERLVRQNRHARVHIAADTQSPSDLMKSVREHFNRYIVYGADYDTIKDIFSWTYNNRAPEFSKTITPKPGEAGMVGQVQPALDNKDIEFLSPVQIAPPPHHHFDVRADGDGWTARTKYLEQEELRRPSEVDGVEWPDVVPEDLTITPYLEGLEDDSNDVDPSVHPLKAFAKQCLTRENNTDLRKTEVYDAFNNYLQNHGHEPFDFEDDSDLATFGKRLPNAVEGEVTSTQVGPDRKPAYVDMALTELGEQYRDLESTSMEPSGEPIPGD